MPYMFYSLFTPEMTTQYFESTEDLEKHKKTVAIVRDLEDMILAAKLCKGKGKKCYLTEAVDDIVWAMSSSETLWPNEIMEKYDVYIAEARLVIAAAEDVSLLFTDEFRHGENNEVTDEDDDLMLRFASRSEDVDVRKRLVARWRK